KFLLINQSIVLIKSPHTSFQPFSPGIEALPRLKFKVLLISRPCSPEWKSILFNEKSIFLRKCFFGEYAVYIYFFRTLYRTNSTINHNGVNSSEVLVDSEIAITTSKNKKNAKIT